MTKATGNREPGSGAMERLLRETIAQVDANAEPKRDLWPDVQRKIHQHAAPVQRLVFVPWFDWALAGGLAVFAVAAPTAIPVLLYYL